LGPVFRAYDADRERLVAIKLFTLDLPPDRVHRLVAEFEQLIAADLTHPSLVRPVATGMSGVAAFLAQEYVAADSLDLAIRQYGPAPADDTLRVAAHLGGALDFAAAVDIHHGALHPRDILLSHEETRLTGLGVAQALERVGVATPVRRPYTAPERTAGRPPDRRADVFSLAAIIFELLSGRRLTGLGAPPHDAVENVAAADAALLRTVFARALAEDPADRFATALEFVEALKGAFVAAAGVAADSYVSGDAAVGSPRSAVNVGPVHQYEQAPLLPLDEPDVSDHDGVEAPIRVESDLPLGEADAQRYETVEAPPAIVEPPHVPLPQEVPTSRSESGVWPLALALAIGMAVGYAGGFSVGSRDRSAASPISDASSVVGAPRSEGPSRAAPREFTETPLVPASKPPVAPRRDAAPRAPAAPVAAPAAGGLAPDASGRLLVRSTPAGAHVFIDGRDVGQTPATIRDLSRGTHRLRIVRDGYAPEDRRVDITRDRPSRSLIVPLERERVATSRVADAGGDAEPTPSTMGRFVGGLSVESRPTGARVYIDGKLIGTTPLAVPSIGAGEHAVRLERDGYRRWSSSIRIVANEGNRVTASLER
jgi:hypothetical protein